MDKLFRIFVLYCDRNGDLNDTYIRRQLSIGVGELLYGTGECFTPFVKNGQTVEIYNEGGGAMDFWAMAVNLFYYKL